LNSHLNLRDIHLPDAVSWWPPAIGWWILLCLILAAIFLLPRLYRALTFKPLNKVSTLAYQNIIRDYQQHQDALLLVTSLSKLLRQISMSYQDRNSAAHLTGDKWVSQLNSLTEENYFCDNTRKLLIQAPYQKKITDNPQPLILATKNWITALPKGKLGIKQ